MSCCNKIVVQNTINSLISIICQEIDTTPLIEVPRVEIEYTVLSSGTYMLDFEAWIDNPTVASTIDVTSLLYKNDVGEAANINYRHRWASNDIDEITYTHKAKIVAVLGDVIGFFVNSTSGCDINNGTLTITKIA